MMKHQVVPQCRGLYASLEPFIQRIQTKAPTRAQGQPKTVTVVWYRKGIYITLQIIMCCTIVNVNVTKR